MNKAIIIGNLTRDPELKKINTGQSVATFGIATNEYWKDKDGNKQEDVQFHNCVSWGQPAEYASSYARKGQKVVIEGKLKTRNWEDDNGVKHYRTEIVCQSFTILSPKKEISTDRGESLDDFDNNNRKATAEDLIFD